MGWDAVGYPSEPITADSATIATQTGHLNAVARTLRDQVARLRNINPGRRS